MLSFVPLGVGDAFSARWYSTSFLLEAEGGRLLVDCPHPLRKMLTESDAGVDVDQLDGVLLTHLHADHCSGLEPLAFFFHFVLGRRLPVWAHPTVLGRLWERLAPGMDRLLAPDGGVRRLGFEDFFEAHPLRLDGAVEAAGFRVEARMTRHHVPTTALRVQADGVRWGYSADTDFDPGLIDWLAPADLIVHETNLGVHTPYERLASLPADLRARMRLVHFTDFFAPTDSAIEPLTQGRRYAIQRRSP